PQAVRQADLDSRAPGEALARGELPEPRRVDLAAGFDPLQEHPEVLVDERLLLLQLLPGRLPPESAGVFQLAALADVHGEAVATQEILRQRPHRDHADRTDHRGRLYDEGAGGGGDQIPG